MKSIKHKILRDTKFKALDLWRFTFARRPRVLTTGQAWFIVDAIEDKTIEKLLIDPIFNQLRKEINELFLKNEEISNVKS